MCKRLNNNIRTGETISIAEAAERLGISEPTLRAALRDGRIPGGLRVGARPWVIARHPFESWPQGPSADVVEQIAERCARRFLCVLSGAFTTLSEKDEYDT